MVGVPSDFALAADCPTPQQHGHVITFSNKIKGKKKKRPFLHGCGSSTALLLVVSPTTMKHLKPGVCNTISMDSRTLLKVGNKYVHAIDSPENNIVSKEISISG